ncbi:bestrophin family protein [Mucilaginibacter jinjuensis]|uniref:Bestrophin family ion channel n=1 Tax=Mucilaginibacter jinjuensis TaxID=1176721 RepID=A0ABY7TGS6_9SPHI|nr:bestrophin family ion channel [Mucilaginibacter jinjuensis]WCT14787.1 bestrophin family ion channel [Mucilaginibacter jinjuensis]
MLLKKNVPVSYVLGKIKVEMALLALYSTTVYVVHTYYHIPLVSIPVAVPSILGTVISLLLAFRSNQAYNRWWEARTLWGAIVNDSRSFARQVLSFIDNTYDDADKKAMKERMIKRQMAWCHSLSQHLRGQSAQPELKRLLSDEERQSVADVHHIPLALMEHHANDLRLLQRMNWINDYQQVAMDDTLTRFSNSMGGCERIKNTVFPVTYSFYIHIMVLFFVMLLPYTLIEFFGVFQIPLVVAISSSFFLIEKMAIHLQDPFENKPTDTPTTTISRNIERDLKMLLKDESPAEVDRPAITVNSTSVYYVL